MLLAKGKITQDVINMLDTWKHTGFTVFCGSRIYPGEATVIENIARYIIRASFSQARMTDLQDQSEVVYQSKKGIKGTSFLNYTFLPVAF